MEFLHPKLIIFLSLIVNSNTTNIENDFHVFNLICYLKKKIASPYVYNFLYFSREFFII